MRKPVVVVSAAAALLLGGGFLATSAAADERPDAPGWSSFWWPSLFGEDSVDDDRAAGDFDSGSDFEDAGSDFDDSGDAEPFSDRGSAEQPVLGDDDEPAAAAGSDDGNRRVEPDAGTPDGYELPDEAAPQEPVQEKPQNPVQPKQAQPKQIREQPRQAQRPATDVMVGARQAVTTRDVSASPGAPVQQRVLRLINQKRRNGGCKPITLDRRLIEAANEHAADMARRDYFAHESPNGDRAGDRVEEAGYRWKRYGENIARGADSAYEVVNGWMNSPSHRENILDCRLREMGVGLAISRDRTPYWVQDFATPKS